MPVSPIGNSVPATSPTGTTKLGTNQFMQLLMAQLKNQDPLQPTDNTQFITQMAQFSTLETLQQIQTSLDSSMGAQLIGQAMSLLGRSVTAASSGGSTVNGVVKGVRLSGSDVLLDLGSTTIHLSDVKEVTAASATGG